MKREASHAGSSVVTPTLHHAHKYIHIAATIPKVIGSADSAPAKIRMFIKVCVSVDGAKRPRSYKPALTHTQIIIMRLFAASIPVPRQIYIYMKVEWEVMHTTNEDLLQPYIQPRTHHVTT